MSEGKMVGEGKGIVLALATALVSGVSIFVNKFGVAESDAVLFTALKNACVAALLFSLLLLLGRGGGWRELRGLPRRAWAKLALLGLVGGSIPFALFFTGLKLTSAAGASFAHKTMFLFVALLSIFFLKQKLAFDKRFFAAAAALLAGNALLIGLPASFDYGIALVLAATAFWACETIYAKRLLEGMSARVVAFGRMFFGAAFLLAFLAVVKPAVFASVSLAQFEWVAFTSVFLLAYVSFWFAGLKHLNPVTATMILLLGSPVTTLLSIAFGYSTPTPQAIAGVTLLAVGAALAVGVSRLARALRALDSLALRRVS